MLIDIFDVKVVDILTIKTCIHHCARFQVFSLRGAKEGLLVLALMTVLTLNAFNMLILIVH